MNSLIHITLFVIFQLVSSSINSPTNINQPLIISPVIDLTTSGTETTLYVRLCPWIAKEGSKVVVNMTRYCYCTQSAANDPSTSSCSVPGPTLKMHDETNITVTVINELDGSKYSYPQSSKYWNKYKDMDITNLHVHGLHVDPAVDDVLVKIPNITGAESHSYPYKIGYHYPGTFWYHAHHHGSTTWQVNMGLHGAIIMESDPDIISDTYDYSILMFEWMYIIPQDICMSVTNNCEVDSDTGLYTTHFSLLTEQLQSQLLAAPDIGGTPITDQDYSMCDIYCQFPANQRNASKYMYDVETELSTSRLSGDAVDNNLLRFFVNGALQPKIEMVTGIYHRLRMVNSLSNWFLQFQFPNDCQWHLLATDGVYVSINAESHGADYPYLNYNLSNPSHNNQYFIQPGGRVDILVKCMREGIYPIKSTTNNSQDSTIQTLRNRVYDNITLFSLEVITIESNVSEATGDEELPIATDYPDKLVGSYIQDFAYAGGGFDSATATSTCPCNYKDPDDKNCSFVLSFGGEPAGVGKVNGKPFGYNISHNYPYSSDSLTLITKNGPHDFTGFQFLITNNGHVYHQHINPFQVMEPVGNNGFIALNTTWWDTMGNNGDAVKMRMWTKDYSGLIIVHCHLLQHEDNGMMGFYGIIEEPYDQCPNQEREDTPTESTEEPNADDAHMYTYAISVILGMMLVMFS